MIFYFVVIINDISMNLKLLLEQLLAEDVDEVAVPVSRARAEKLALFVQGGSEPGIVLYNPSRILNEFKYAEPSTLEDDILQVVIDARATVGFISYTKQPTLGCYSVNLSAAEKEYGPLVYDLLLSTLYPEFLTSDREQVSKSAQKVWSYYFNNRKDVEKQLIPGAELVKNYGHTVPVIGNELRDIVREYWPIEGELRGLEAFKATRAFIAKKQGLKLEQQKLVDEYKKRIMDNPLAFMYRIQKPKSFVSLINNHKAFCSTAPSQYSRAQLEEVLFDAGDQWARGKIPW